MRTKLALAFALAVAATIAAACGGPQPKAQGPLVDEGSAVPDDCCCKYTSIASEEAKPTYDHQNRMECSTKQGTCVDDVQCQGAATP